MKKKKQKQQISMKCNQLITSGWWGFKRCVFIAGGDMKKNGRAEKKNNNNK